jgi:hypothetical protein
MHAITSKRRLTTATARAENNPLSLTSHPRPELSSDQNMVHGLLLLPLDTSAKANETALWK